MNFILMPVLKAFGAGKIFLYVWNELKPTLEEWAAADGEYDWDDQAVEALDAMITGIVIKKEASSK